MDKQTKLKIALPVLILIMAFVWGPVIMGGGSKKKDSEIGGVGSSSGLKGSNAELLRLAKSSKRRKARTSYTQWKRNPFMPSESPKASVLEGIMWDAQNPKAIINGYILGIGERVGAGYITDIQQTSVTIKTGKSERIYKLGQ